MGNINVTPQYVLAGNATFTVSNGAKHFTYRARKAPDTGLWFLFVLSNPNNPANDGYTYVGRIIPPKTVGFRPQIKRTQKTKFPVTSSVWRVGEWALRVIWQAANWGYDLPAGMSIKHNGHCGVCGRALTHPASLDTGIGPECAARLGVEWAERNTRQPELPVDDPNARRTKQNPGPNRRKGPRTLHIIDEHTSARDYILACAGLRSFFDPSKHHGGW